MSTAADAAAGPELPPTLRRAVRALLSSAEAASQVGRRSGVDGSERLPLGSKALRTRQLLLQRAYELFVARGYLSTSVQDIHEAAGVSLGTFYQYFSDRADVMRTLVGEAVISSSGNVFRPLDLSEGRDGVHRVIDGYVRGYAATADFQRVWEEVTLVDEDLASLRNKITAVIDASVAHAIDVGQRAGIVDPDIDSPRAARALTAMADRYCYLSFVVDRPGTERATERTTETTIAVLTDLWTRALGLPAA